LRLLWLHSSLAGMVKSSGVQFLNFHTSLSSFCCYSWCHCQWWSWWRVCSDKLSFFFVWIELPVALLHWHMKQVQLI
jgi:hypothetical protein